MNHLRYKETLKQMMETDDSTFPEGYYYIDPDGLKLPKRFLTMEGHDESISYLFNTCANQPYSLKYFNKEILSIIKIMIITEQETWKIRETTANNYFREYLWLFKRVEKWPPIKFSKEKVKNYFFKYERNK